ncbi:MAG TPA: hypothetical protein VJ608_12205 [Albitalea sp.]|nr:hypothetical protein [Albitalea sp.]
MTTRKPKVTKAKPAPAPEPAIDNADSAESSIVARPDGYYWIASDGKQEFGPFESIEAALADMGGADEQSPEPAETLQEAEDEIGIADWIDPETGEPAEGRGPPHLEEE